jgi:hypothetical protein
MSINWRYVHLLGGILLFATGALFLLRLSNAWNPFWRELQPAAQHTAPAKPADPALDPAKMEVYGMLASAASSESTSDDPDAPPRPRAPAAAIDHIVAAPTNAPARFLHKKFSVKRFEGFELIVPAHTFHPKVHGTYKSSLSGGGSDDDAELTVMLLNETEFGAFISGEDITGRFSTESSRSGEVDWALNSPAFQADKYYLIFLGTSNRVRNKIVEADFTMSSE